MVLMELIRWRILFSIKVLYFALPHKVNITRKQLIILSSSSPASRDRAPGHAHTLTGAQSLGETQGCCSASTLRGFFLGRTLFTRARWVHLYSNMISCGFYLLSPPPSPPLSVLLQREEMFPACSEWNPRMLSVAALATTSSDEDKTPLFL